MTSECLFCHCELVLSQSVVEGERIICPACEAKLEIVSVQPLELDWAYDQPPRDVWIADRTARMLGTPPHI